MLEVIRRRQTHTTLGGQSATFNDSRTPRCRIHTGDSCHDKPRTVTVAGGLQVFAAPGSLYRASDHSKTVPVEDITLSRLSATHHPQPGQHRRQSPFCSHRPPSQPPHCPLYLGHCLPYTARPPHRPESSPGSDRQSEGPDEPPSTQQRSSECRTDQYPSARWPSGLRRCVKVSGIPSFDENRTDNPEHSAVFGRGFESHSRQEGIQLPSQPFWQSLGGVRVQEMK